MGSSMAESYVSIKPSVIQAKLRAGWSDVDIAEMLECPVETVAAYRRMMIEHADDYMVPTRIS